VARPQSRYVCQSCGEAFLRWEGQCRACGGWNSLVETVVREPTAGERARVRARSVAGTAGAEPTPLSQIGEAPVPRLQVGDREIKASFVQNERTALRQDDGVYLARCVYGFPVRDLDGRARAALVIADADGRHVGRFTLDLSSMR